MDGWFNHVCLRSVAPPSWRATAWRVLEPSPLHHPHGAGDQCLQPCCYMLWCRDASLNRSVQSISSRASISLICLSTSPGHHSNHVAVYTGSPGCPTIKTIWRAVSVASSTELDADPAAQSLNEPAAPHIVHTCSLPKHLAGSLLSISHIHHHSCDDFRMVCYGLLSSNDVDHHDMLAMSMFKLSPLLPRTPPTCHDQHSISRLVDEFKVYVCHVHLGEVIIQSAIRISCLMLCRF